MSFNDNSTCHRITTANEQSAEINACEFCDSQVDERLCSLEFFMLSMENTAASSASYSLLTLWIVFWFTQFFDAEIASITTLQVW